MKRRFVLRIYVIGVVGCIALHGCRSSQKSINVGARTINSTPRSADEEPGQISLSSVTDPKIAKTLPFHDDADAESVIPVTWEKASQIPPGPSELDVDKASQVPNAPVLTLDESMQLAVEANPTLRQAYAFVQQAQGNWPQVGLYPNPKVEWHDEANNAPFDAHYGIVSQNIVTADKLKLNRATASADVQRAQWEAEAQNLRVLNAVRINYIAALGAQRQVAVAEQILKIADEGVRVSKLKLKAEEVSEADVLQAQIQQRQTQILLRNARIRAAAAWRELSNVIGWPNLPVRPLAGELEDEIPQLDWDVAWQDLVSRNPLLHAARARMAAAEVQVQREQVEAIPNLQVSGGTGPDVLPAGKGFQMYFLSLGAEVPVWNRNQGNVTAAMANLQAAQAEVSRLELSLRDDLANTFQRYESARNEVEIYQEQILPTADKNLSLSQKAYDEGEFDFLRVLIARRDLFEARVNYVASLTELRAAAIEIQGLLLTGGLDPVFNNPTPSNSAGQTSDQGR